MEDMLYVLREIREELKDINSELRGIRTDELEEIKSATKGMEDELYALGEIREGLKDASRKLEHELKDIKHELDSIKRATEITEARCQGINQSIGCLTSVFLWPLIITSLFLVYWFFIR
jgi:chromosome segregation ATPase